MIFISDSRCVGEATAQEENRHELRGFRLDGDRARSEAKAPSAPTYLCAHATPTHHKHSNIFVLKYEIKLLRRRPCNVRPVPSRSLLNQHFLDGRLCFRRGSLHNRTDLMTFRGKMKIDKAFRPEKLKNFVSI